MRVGRGAAAAAGVAAVLLAASAGILRTSSPAFPTHTVTRGAFRNDVVTFGRLQAVRSTAVTVPADLQQPMRVAWLAVAGPVKRGDPVVRFDPTEAENQYENGRSDRAAAESRRRKATAEGSQAETVLGLDRGLAEEELRRAEDVAPSDAQIFSRNEIVESRIDRDVLKRRVETADAKGLPTKRRSAAEVALADIDRGKADLRVRQAEKSLRALTVTAPHDGVLVYPLFWRGEAIAVGDTAWPGQPVAELPDLSALEARVFVLEADGAGVAAGQSAKVEVEGQPGLTFEAKVSRVDALAKNRDRQSPVKYFETTLALGSGPSNARLKPGQRVRAILHAGALDGVLTVPRGALFEKEGRRLVYRLEDGRFRAVEVGIGPRSLARVVIEKGLQAGDRVALQDPERRASASPSPREPAAAGGPR